MYDKGLAVHVEISMKYCSQIKAYKFASSWNPRVFERPNFRNLGPSQTRLAWTPLAEKVLPSMNNDDELSLKYTKLLQVPWLLHIEPPKCRFLAPSSVFTCHAVSALNSTTTGRRCRGKLLVRAKSLCGRYSRKKRGQHWVPGLPEAKRI